MPGLHRSGAESVRPEVVEDSLVLYHGPGRRTSDAEAVMAGEAWLFGKAFCVRALIWIPRILL